MMPSYAEWMRTTDAGIVARRGADLERVDAALAAYDRTRSRAALEALDLEFKNWKRKNPRWNTSARNRNGALTNFGKALLERVDVMLRQQNFLWCPGVDDEMKRIGRGMIGDLMLDGTLYEGGATGLEKFSSNAKCYILAHANTDMPVVQTKKGKWNSAEIAAMLLASGLNPEIRQIEMLVCHAGESVNNAAAGNKLYELFRKYKAAQAAQNETLAAAVEAQYAAASALTTDPKFYEDGSNPFTESDEQRERRLTKQSEQLLPVAASLSDALKKLGFSNFTLTSYRAPVNTNFGAKVYENGVRSPAGVRLDLDEKRKTDPKVGALAKQGNHLAYLYALASDWPEYAVVWR
ncbi:hypothetical protein [Trinickia dinghuensis]|nr:hypothetical protein [Trinickia dinghuensis]